MAIAVKVETLSKKYIIRHQGAVRQSALREVLAENARAAYRRIINPFSEALRQAETAEEFWALRDVSFEIKAGDRLGIIGRNGAGKSTLLKVLSRITEPTSGKVSIKGRVSSLLEVGTGFHPELTGRENIYLNGAILGMSRFEIKRKFDEIVDFAEIERFLDTPVKRYSSGMYVRLAFAVAAHLEPEILIIDEVLAVGDAHFQQKCLGKMRDVGQTGRTVIFVSHNMTAVSSLCQKVVVLRDGKATAPQPVKDAVDIYLSMEDRKTPENFWVGNVGDESIVLRGLFVQNQAETMEFRTDEDLSVVIKLEVLRKVRDVVVGVHLLSDSGAELAFSAQFDSEKAALPSEYSPGVYSFKLRIPANSLAQGKFRIVPNIGIHNIKRIVGDEVQVLFSLNNTNGLGRKFFTGKGLENIFRPEWRWDIL